GLVERDGAGADRGAGPVLHGKAASEPVATVTALAAVAPLGLIVHEDAAGECQSRLVGGAHQGAEADLDSAAHAGAAGGAGAADGVVVQEDRVADCGGRGIAPRLLGFVEAAAAAKAAG